MRSLHTRQYKAFVAVLVDARNKAGQTQHNVAELLKKPQSFVSKYERGERRLDVPEFLAICRALDANPVTLLKRIAVAIEAL